MIKAIFFDFNGVIIDDEIAPKTLEALAGLPELKHLGVGSRRRRRRRAGRTPEAPRVTSLVVRDLGRSGRVSAKGWAAVAALPVAQLDLLAPSGLDAAVCGQIAGMPNLTGLSSATSWWARPPCANSHAARNSGRSPSKSCRLPTAGLKHVGGMKTLELLFLYNQPLPTRTWKGWPA